jgi:WhiB family redox-sensing transcriptional regulator
MDAASCREIGQDFAFPEDALESKQAIAICKTCPVQTECLEYALTFTCYGIWGGTTEAQRRRLRTRRNKEMPMRIA